MTHRSPQGARRRGRRRTLSAAGVPAAERPARAPGRHGRAARGSGAPGRRHSPRGSRRRALRRERRVRREARGAGQGWAGRGAGGWAGSLTGDCRRAGGCRQLLQEAHRHFQDIRLLQLRAAGALRPGTRERDGETDSQDGSPAGSLGPLPPPPPPPLRSGPQLGARATAGGAGRLPGTSPTCARPALGAGRGPVAGSGAQGDPRSRAPALLAPRAGPARPHAWAHLQAEPRQDERAELPQALVDARAAALLQQRLQALRGAETAVTRRPGSAHRHGPGPGRRLLPYAAPPAVAPSEAAPCSTGRRPRRGPVLRRPAPARAQHGRKRPTAQSRQRHWGAPRRSLALRRRCRPVPPRPAPRSQAARGPHLPPLFPPRVARGERWEGAQQSPRDLAPALRVPSASGSQAQGAPQPRQGCVWAASQPWRP